MELQPLAVGLEPTARCRRVTNPVGAEKYKKIIDTCLWNLKRIYTIKKPSVFSILW